MERKKIIGVLFSGGLDSTYLIWDNLRKGNEVYPFYFEIKNNRDKPILEKNRVSLLHKEFHKEFGESIHTPKFVLELMVNDVNTRTYLHQVPIWILGLLFSQLNYLDEIQIGYVMNDDAVSYVDDIKKIYNSYNRISDKLTPIVFPLLKYKKDDLISQLPMKYRELTITCEEPTITNDPNTYCLGGETELIEYDPCGRCPACRRIIDNKYYGDDVPKSYERNEIERSMNCLLKLGKKVEDKREDNRYIVTIELPDESPQIKKQPQQLSLDFE